MKNLVIIILALTTVTFANAQTEILAAVTSPALVEDFGGGAFGEVLTEGNVSKSADELVPGFYRAPKAMTTEFTGYTVQIATSNRQLDKEDKLFQEFGGIMVEENLNPKYAYYVGQFRTKEGAEKYVATVIGSRYATAKVVAYKNGKQVNKLK